MIVARRAGRWPRGKRLIQIGVTVLVSINEGQRLHLGHEFFHVELSEATFSELGLLLDSVHVFLLLELLAHLAGGLLHLDHAVVSV